MSNTPNTLTKRIDRDKLNMTPRIDIAHAAIRAISAVQDDEPGAAIMGIAGVANPDYSSGLKNEKLRAHCRRA